MDCDRARPGAAPRRSGLAPPRPGRAPAAGRAAGVPVPVRRDHEPAHGALHAVAGPGPGASGPAPRGRPCGAHLAGGVPCGAAPLAGPLGAAGVAAGLAPGRDPAAGPHHRHPRLCRRRRTAAARSGIMHDRSGKETAPVGARGRGLCPSVALRGRGPPTGAPRGRRRNWNGISSRTSRPASGRCFRSWIARSRRAVPGRH